MIILAVGIIDEAIQENIEKLGGRIKTAPLIGHMIYLVNMPEHTRYQENEGRHIYVIHDGNHHTLGVYELILVDNQNVIEASLVDW